MSERPQKKRRRSLSALGIVATGMCLLCIIGTIASPKKEDASPQEPTHSATIEEVSQAKETATATTILKSSTDTPEPTALPAAPTLAVSADPLVSLEDKIRTVLGSGNRDVSRVRQVSTNYSDTPGALYVEWSINDNLTENMVRSGAQYDASKILQAISQSGIDYQEVWLSGWFPMVDVYGNTKEKEVIGPIYDRETIERINWEDFDWHNIWIIKDGGYVHPAFRDD